MNTDEVQRTLSRFWDESIVPTLHDFIRIPNESPLFDPDWQAHGHMEEAVTLVTRWIEQQQVPGAKLEVLRDGKRTPLLLLEIPGATDDTVLMYGHIDKQPPMVGWREDLGPWTPVMDGEGRLYGRGGADDGYAVFAALATVKALKDAGQPHGRIAILIECSEESGSPDLPHYIRAYGDRIGEPDLVVCLDSGAGNYEQLWGTTSLRGTMLVRLTVQVLTEGVHSGINGGIVPSCQQVLRLLLDRLEDARTGKLLPPELHVDVPSERLEQTRKAAQVLGGRIVSDVPLAEGVQPLSDDYTELLLNTAWRPALAITGQDGMPPVEKGGNVLLPELTWKLSMRLPPTLDAEEAEQVIRRVLTEDPPFGAKVRVDCQAAAGWNAPETARWLAEAIEGASREFFGKEACYIGLGGSIPFMDMLGRQFPKAQFFITGVLGPKSNAHDPNEFLHVPYAKQLNCCLVRLLEAHHAHAAGGATP